MKRIAIRITKRHIIAVLLFIIGVTGISLLLILTDRLSLFGDAIVAKRVIKTAIYSIGITFLIVFLDERRRQKQRQLGWFRWSFALTITAVIVFFVMWFFDWAFRWI